MPRSEALRRRGRLNALQRHRSPGDPAILDAARDLAAERLADHIRHVVDTAPPLNAEQIEQLRGLLPAPATRNDPGGTAA